MLAVRLSLKIRLVLISSSVIANHDVIITIKDWDQTRKGDFFFSGLRPRFLRLAALPLACLGFACSNFAKKNKRLLVVYSSPFGGVAISHAWAAREKRRRCLSSRGSLRSPEMFLWAKLDVQCTTTTWNYHFLMRRLMKDVNMRGRIFLSLFEPGESL